MKKGMGFVIGGLVCALAGAGIEYARNQFIVMPALIARIAAEQDEKSDERESTRVVRVIDESAQNEVVLLKKRVEELEAQTRAGQNGGALQPPGPVAESAQVAEERRTPRTNQVSRFRSQSTPEQREERRLFMEQTMAEHYTFLESVDQKNMDQAQRENHAKLLEKVAQMNELRNALLASNERPNSETIQLLRETDGELRELYASERQYMLQSLGRSSGLSGDQSAAFAEQIQQIYQNTSMPHFMGGRGGHH
jgi:type IV secretory pathway VirB10-like protein